MSCITSVAIKTLLEAVLQHLCSSTLCLQQGRGSTLVSLFLQKLLFKHISLQVFLQHFFSFSPVTKICFRLPLYCGCYCIPMRYKSSFESYSSYVHLIRTVRSAVLPHMLLGILLQPCSHVGSEPWHQSSSGPYCLHFNRTVQKICMLSRKYPNLLDNKVPLTALWSVLLVC